MVKAERTISCYSKLFLCSSFMNGSLMYVGVLPMGIRVFIGTVELFALLNFVNVIKKN